MKKKTLILFFVAVFIAMLFPSAASADSIVITKDPTGETKDVGETAYFIAYADNADSITWYLVRTEENVSVEASKASEYFPTLKVDGYDEDTLILSNMPYDLNGWGVRARFSGPEGDAYTKTALITMNSVELSIPVITVQPQGGEIGSTGRYTLSCTVDTTGQGSIKYQWFSNGVSSVSGAREIDGADSAQYVVSGIEGTEYYFVSVCTTDGVNSSAAIYSNIVPVTASSQAASVDDTMPAGETAAPSALDAGGIQVTEGERVQVVIPRSPTESNGNSPVIYILVAAAVLAVAVICLTIILIKTRKDEDTDS